MCLPFSSSLSLSLRCEWVLEFSAFEMNTFLDKFIHQYRKEKENVLSHFSFLLFNSNVICIRLWVRTPVVGDDSPILTRNYYFDSNVSHTCCIQWARSLNLTHTKSSNQNSNSKSFPTKREKKITNHRFYSWSIQRYAKSIMLVVKRVATSGRSVSFFFVNNLILIHIAVFHFPFFVALSLSSIFLSALLSFFSLCSNKSGVDRGALLILMCIAQPMFVMIDKAKTQNELNHF